MPAFEIIDTSGDAGIRAFGADLPGLFINAATGLFHLMTDLENIREEQTLDITARGSSLEGLLVAWLNELIFRFDAYGFLGRGFRVLSLDIPGTGTDYSITASVRGEDFDETRHERHLLVKAATYHHLKIEPDDAGFVAEIIFDI